MTAMASISTGHSPQYLTREVAAGRESYYLDATVAGEPPGRWWGAGAEALGLSGIVDEDTMHELYSEWRNPATGERLGRQGPAKFKWDGMTAAEIETRMLAEEPNALPERRAAIHKAAEKAASKKTAMFHDVTLSAPKSYTVVHTAMRRQQLAAERAGDEAEAERWRQGVEALDSAFWEANRAMLSVLEESAGYSRKGKHTGAGGEWIDAHALTVASFHQSDSRDHDPQQHIHNAILAKVKCADGQWRSIDSQQLYAQRAYAAAVAGRVLSERTHAALGLWWDQRADGVGREIRGVPQEIMDALSSRRANISARLEELVAEYEQQHGRKASASEMVMLSRSATMSTRAAKSHAGQTREQQLDAWERKTREQVGQSLREVAETVAAGAGERRSTGEKFSRAGIVAEAIAACQETQPTFRRADLARQIELRLPMLGTADVGEIRRVIDTLTDEGMAQLEQVTGRDQTLAAAPLRLANGQSALLNPSGARFVSRQHLASEQALHEATIARDRSRVSRAEADAWLATYGETLSEGQAAAIRGLLTSGARVSQLIGPAGTGKSYTVGQLRAAWADLAGGQVIGLATAERAAEVLREDSVPAMNTARWLETREGRNGPFELTPNHIVVVDEASMVDRAMVDRVRERIEAAGARLVTTGDPAQLTAVGAGGVMDLISGDGADVYTLDDVRRFDADWEKEASLRLRAGEEDVVDDYHRHGRIREAATRELARQAAAEAYVADVAAGRSSVVVASTNEEAAQVARTVRDMLVARGEVEASGVELGLDGNTAGVGDVVMARLNNRTQHVTNRARYDVLEVLPSGGLRVRDQHGAERQMSADYVRGHVQLAYAGTVHAAQGVTVETGHLLVGPGMGRDHLYVGMTRGRQRNTAWTSQAIERPGDVPGEVALRGQRSGPQQVRQLLATEREAERAALMQAAEDLARSRNLATVTAHLTEATAHVAEQRLARQLDELTEQGRITPEQRAQLATEQGTRQLAKLLRVAEQAGHDPAGVLDKVAPSTPDPDTGRRVGDLSSARSLSQTLHSRIRVAYADQLAPVPGAAPVPAGADENWAQFIASLEETAQQRRAELGEQATEEAPEWITAQLGPVPADAEQRQQWTHRAGVLAGWAEITGREPQSEADLLGVAPGLSTPERRAQWFEAWSAAGRPDTTRAEHELSVGQLRNRVQAWQREQQWAPTWVDDQQRATEQRMADLAVQREAPGITEEERAAVDLEMKDLAAAAAQLEQQAAARRAWDRHTAMTATLAERAEAELAARGEPAVGDEPDRITAEELLAEQARGIATDDEHRPIHEDDIADMWTVQAQARAAAGERSAADIDQEAASTASPAAVDRDDASRAVGEPEQAADDHAARQDVGQDGAGSEQQRSRDDLGLFGISRDGHFYWGTEHGYWGEEVGPDIERHDDAARQEAPEEPATSDEVAAATDRAEAVALRVRIREQLDAQRAADADRQEYERRAAAADERAAERDADRSREASM